MNILRIYDPPKSSIYRHITQLFTKKIANSLIVVGGICTRIKPRNDSEMICMQKYYNLVRQD